MTATKTACPALTVGALSLVSIRPDRVLLVGGELTLAAAQAFVGRTLTVQTTQAHEARAVKLASVSQNRDTGDVNFWATWGEGLGCHLRAVTQ